MHVHLTPSAVHQHALFRLPQKSWAVAVGEANAEALYGGKALADVFVEALAKGAPLLCRAVRSRASATAEMRGLRCRARA